MHRTARGLVTAALTALLLTAGCTSSDSPADGADPTTGSGPSSDGGSSGGSDAPAAGAPSCSSVWKVGEDLPSDYTECADGSAVGNQDVTACRDGSSLIVFDDAFWAVTGQKIVRPDIAPLQDTAAYGSAYSACTGE